MGMLLKLIGEERYNRIKKAMGDAFSAFEKLFEDGNADIKTVEEKEKELGISTEGGDGGTGGKGNDGDGKGDDGGTNSGGNPTNSTGIKFTDNGELDIESIKDVQLKNYIVNLHNKVGGMENTYKRKTAVLMEAIKHGMHNVEDATKFIDIDSLEVKDGKVLGISKVFSDLKQNKPYLFSGESKSNPIDEGFNPANGKGKDIKPRSYAEALELQKSIEEGN